MEDAREAEWQSGEKATDLSHVAKPPPSLSIGIEMSELSELFDRDPLLLTDRDIAEIIARMRQAQYQYELGTPKAAPKTPVKKSNKTLDILKDLGLT